MFEWTKNHTSQRWNFILLLLQLWCVHRASGTEIRVNQWFSTRILGLQVSLPVVMECQSLPPGYQEVLWYRDDVLVAKKSGTYAYQLELLRMMWNNVSEDLDYALKFQGYYWCETNNMGVIEATKYSFRIQGIHTFAGKFVATRDYLDETGESGLRDELRRASYEKDIQEVLFGFIPTPNTYVHNVTVVETGMEVRFYLYIGQFNNWRPIWSDQLYREQVLDGLHRKDEMMEDWMKRRGIERITLRSTLGCYRYTYMVPADIPQDIASGSDVISREVCSAKNGSSVTPVCIGDSYSGFRWIDPSGRCNILPSKFNFGGDPRPIYRTRLLRMTSGTSNMPTVAGLNILKEFSETYDLNLKEMEAVVSAINHLFDVDRSKLEKAKSDYNLTSMLLRIMDNVLAKASQRDDKVVISRDHLVLSVQRFGIEKGREFVPEASTLMYTLLPRELQTGIPNTSQVFVFFEDCLLFPDPEEVLTGNNHRVLPSPAMYLTVNGGTLWNSTYPLQIYFRNGYGDAVENPVCVHFDRGMKDGKGGWSTDGCEYSGIKDGFFSCTCDGHSIFSIVLSLRRGYKIPDFKFPELKIKYSGEVPQKSFSILNLLWIIPLGILMVVIRIAITRWCRSLWYA